MTAAAFEPSHQQRLFDLFDAARGFGYTSITLFDRGAADSLRAWAALHSIAVEERSYGYGDRHLVATARGLEIAVQLTATTEGR